MHPKYRCVDHGGAPFFTIGQLEQEPEATDHLGLVGLKWVAACQREAADEGNASGLEDYGLGTPCALAIALEKATDANALGMIEAKTGIDSVDALKAVGEMSRRQRSRIDPAT